MDKTGKTRGVNTFCSAFDKSFSKAPGNQIFRETGKLLGNLVSGHFSMVRSFSFFKIFLYQTAVYGRISEFESFVDWIVSCNVTPYGNRKILQILIDRNF